MDDQTVKAPRRTIPAPGAGTSKTLHVPPPIGHAEAPDAGGIVEFMTEAGSPFGDGYSIAREEAALADLFEMDDPDKDPRWARYTLLIERKELLAHHKTNYRLEQGPKRKCSTSMRSR